MRMRDLSELNINERGVPVTRPAPTDDDWARFESRYDIKAPSALRQLLGYSNGGHPELDSIPSTSGGGGGSRYSVNRFYYLSADELTGSLQYAMKHWRPILGAKALPFASDSGGNQFYVDLEDGSVRLCLHDAQMRTITVASN